MTATREQISEFLSRINYSEERFLEELKKSGRKDIKIVLCLCSVDEIERVYGLSSVANMDSLRA